ncbi:MAG TPA: hypothetical protein VD902_16425, partial [Symbiobacteriaceae bacterium]|nr:hypothetical protein [Symbiobacteriaceae bacterium]
MDDYTRFLVAARDLDRRLGPVEPASPAAIPVDEFLSRLGEFRRLLAQFYPDLTAELTEQAQAVEQASDEARTALTGALALGDSDLVCELAQR